MPTAPFTPPPEALARARALLDAAKADGRRRLLGLVGPPGAGKSTLAEALRQAFDPSDPGAVALVPMDGFHLAQAELERLGRAARKGAPDTFDAAGYAALLRRLRDDARLEHGATVYAPAFHREIEEPVAGAIAIDPAVRVVITEGNYLLLDEGPWAAVRPLLDACWYLDVDPARRVPRLIARHVTFGRSPVAAHEWVMRSDEANTRLVEATRARADWCQPWG